MEAPPTFQQALRPLGLGELLDRAVTLTVRNFPGLAFVWIIFAIPLAVCAFLGTEDQSKVFASLADVLKTQASGHADTNAMSKALQSNPVFNGWTIAYIGGLMLEITLVQTALTAAVGARYQGGRSDLATCYRIAVSRFPNIIMFDLIWLFFGGLVWVVLALIAAAVIFVGFAVGFLLHAVGITIAVILGIVVGIVLFLALLVLAVAYEVGFMTCVLEERNFAAAFGAGLQRVFGGVGFRRSMLAGLVYLAFSIGTFMVSMLGQVVILGLVRSQALGLAYSTVLQVIVAVFVTVFFVLFYFDLRVREEGYDLQLAVAAAPTA
jgi:hypothetical protein